MVTITPDMVRSYLLTEVKRKILEAFLKDGTQLVGFRTVKQHILNLDLERIESDLRLIKELLAREIM